MVSFSLELPVAQKRTLSGGLLCFLELISSAFPLLYLHFWSWHPLDLLLISAILIASTSVFLLRLCRIFPWVVNLLWVIGLWKFVWRSESKVTTALSCIILLSENRANNGIFLIVACGYQEEKTSSHLSFLNTTFWNCVGLVKKCVAMLLSGEHPFWVFPR